MKKKAEPKTSPIENFDLDLKPFNTTSSKKKKNIKPIISPSNKTSVTTTISDLKDLVSSRSDSLKRSIDLYHSQILKEFEASHSRLSKRIKVHSQATQQMMDEASKEHKRVSDLIIDNVEAMTTSYAEIIAKAEGSANRFCKTSIPELAHSMERAIDGLRSRYGVPVTAA